VSFNPFIAFRVRLDPFQGVDVDLVLLAVVFTNREQAIAAFRPREFGDLDLLANDFGVKRAFHAVRDHRQQAGMLLVLVVAIDRGLLDQSEEVFAFLMFVHFVSSEEHREWGMGNNFLVPHSPFPTPDVFIVSGRRWRRAERLLYSIL